MNDTIKEAFDQKWGPWLSLYTEREKHTMQVVWATGWTAGRMQMSDERHAELMARIAEMDGETDVHTP